MLLAMMIPAANTVYVRPGFAIPPGCQGFEIVECEGLDLYNVGVSYGSVMLGGGYTLRQVDGMILYQSDKSIKRKTQTIEVAIEHCGSCGKSHTLNVTLLMALFPGQTAQGRAACPETGQPLIIAPVVAGA